MATTRELLEAEAWQRRRIVRAHLSGDPDHPARPQLRPLLAGLALAATYVVARVVLGVLGVPG